MKKNLILFASICLLVVGMFVDGQYYYFDTNTSPQTSTYPYQQGCSETLAVRVNTEGTGIIAGLLQLQLDPLAYFYNTSDISTVLQTNLFLGSTEVFSVWTSPDQTPSWVVGSNYTRIQMDRNNGATPSFSSNGLYGLLKFTPLYNISTGVVSIVYAFGDTTMTTLSVGGVNKINSSSQNSQLTGTYSFLQEPCVADTNNPIMTLNTPSINTKVSYTNGVILNLNDASGVSGIGNVPYVWSGGVWTGNAGGLISNQYGIDPETFVLYINGNGTGKIYTNSDGILITGVQKTWQDNISNYMVNINPEDLFDFGIEKTIVITGSVKDRNNNQSSVLSFTFNNPVGPTLISDSRSPSASAVYVNLSTPVRLGIQDDWAGVNSGSIVVTLSGINGTNYGPYQFSGSDLNLSGIVGIANQPDWYIDINNHVDFSTSGTIRVSVYAEDMEGNVDTISDYNFFTRPDCSEFQCCNPIDIDVKGIITPYVLSNLYVSGGINAYLTGEDLTQTGYLYCGTENEGLLIYSGHGNFSGDASYLQFTDISDLVFSGNNIVAYLTGENGDTILLVRFGNFVIKVFPGSRPGGNLANIGELRLYDIDKNFIISGSIESSSTGSSEWLDNVPSGTYYIVYKGQSHLASYLSGVVITQGEVMEFDFTTGSNLYDTQQKSNLVDDGYRYQIAGDLKNTNGEYDFVINGNDISVIVFGSGFVEGGISVLDPKNINGDGSINGADIAVVGINFQLKDQFVDSLDSLFIW
ncbi:MAG: hypothetical protein PHR61_03420 [Candidatus Absconditabacteria bacterium]|nr:hypothetical protein [Candidatus Absconditabacteria bacterium]